MSTPEKPPLSKDRLVKALQNLYSDRDKLADRIEQMSSELEEVKKVLINILKIQKDLHDFEMKVFTKNLEK